VTGTPDPTAADFAALKRRCTMLAKQAKDAYEAGRTEGLRQAAASPTIEHGIRMTGGGHHIRPDHPEIERIFPLADWIRASQRNGGKVDTRRVIVVNDWTEVTNRD
jgi:hypothetical protein